MRVEVVYSDKGNACGKTHRFRESAPHEQGTGQARTFRHRDKIYIAGSAARILQSFLHDRKDIFDMEPRSYLGDDPAVRRMQMHA